MVSTIKEDMSYRDREMELYREEVFNKPLDKLTVSDFTRMATFITSELGYEIATWLYIHEYMRQYVAKRRGTNNSLTGREIYNRTKRKAPKYRNILKREGKLTKDHARQFRDTGWEVIPEPR